MKSTVPISSSGMTLSIKEEQGLEAPKLTFTKSSVLDTIKEELVTAEVVKENGSVENDLPDALKSLNELFDLSAILSNFTCGFKELHQHMEFIAKSIDGLYKLQNVKESEVVGMVPKPNASTSGSCAALVMSSSKQIDKSIDDMHKLQNTNESPMVVMVPEPNASTSGSYAAPVLSSSNQFDNMHTLQNNESEVAVTVPEPNVLTSRSPGPPFFSSSNQIDKFRPQNVEETEVVVVAPKPNASTSRSSAPPVSPFSNSVARNPDNRKSCKEASGINLEVLCRSMSSRGFRKYIQSQLYNVGKVREEAVAALKCAPDPAKLVLKSFGRFYLNSSKSYAKNSPQITNRLACLLILEFFLLSNCTSIESSIKNEAELGAINWKKRLIQEGGISNACIEDARGLLLLVASYGIPSDFSNEELIELVRSGKSRKIANALRQSRSLIERICDIIQGMVEKKMYIAAAEVAHSCDMKEKFPIEGILSSFLQEAKEECELSTSSKCSPEKLKEAIEKKLAAFKTVAKSLEDYKIAPNKLSGCSIHAEIAELEKVISDLVNAIGGKRKAYVNGNNVIEFGRQQGSLVKNPESVKGNSDVDTAVGGKRKAHVNNNVNAFVKSEAKQPRTSGVVSPQIHGTFALPQEQKAHGLINGSMFNDGRLSQFNGFTGVSSAMGYAPSGSAGSGALHGTLAGNFAEASVGDTWVAALHGTNPGNGDVTRVWHAPGSGGVFSVAPPVPYVDGGAWSRSWHGDGTPNDNSLRRDFVGNPTFVDGNLPLPASSTEQGFPGHPNTSIGVGNGKSNASLYQFADSF